VYRTRSFRSRAFGLRAASGPVSSEPTVPGGHNQHFRQRERIGSEVVGDLANKLVGVGRLDLLDAVASRATIYYDARGEQGFGSSGRT